MWRRWRRLTVIRDVLDLPSPPRVSARMSRDLDLLRACSALVVVLGHVRGLFFVEWKLVLKPSIAQRAAYLVTSFGHEAVMVFFVLSGFFISSTVLRAAKYHQWSWQRYLIQRGTRIWIVLVPAVVLGLLWDYAGIHLFAAGQVYSGLPSDTNILNFSVADRLNASTFLGNLMLLQGILVEPFGSNNPLWSLSYEFWYYLMFPCLIFALCAPDKRWCLVNAGICVVILVFVGRTISAYFLIWLLGVLPAIVPLPTAVKRLPALSLIVGGGALLFVALVSARMIRSAIVGDILVGCAAALLLYAICLPQRSSPEVANGKIPFGGYLVKLMAGFSYTLYLVHIPALIFLHAWINTINVGKWQPDLPHAALALGIVTAILVYAWLISLVTEDHTSRVRRTLERLFCEYRAGVPTQMQSRVVQHRLEERAASDSTFHDS